MLVIIFNELDEKKNDEQFLLSGHGVDSHRNIMILCLEILEPVTTRDLTGSVSIIMWTEGGSRVSTKQYPPSPPPPLVHIPTWFILLVCRGTPEQFIYYQTERIIIAF